METPSETPSEAPTKTSHAEALKSSSVIGGATAIVMVIRMVRTKAMAVILGPVGIGVESMYDSIINLARTFTDFGISSSGVRQIASAVGTGDEQVIARTVTTLRRVCLVLGILGAAALFLFRNGISWKIFGTTEYGPAVGLLSLVTLCGALTSGQGALLQGMRRIGDLAKMNIGGALAAAVTSVPVVYFFGVPGIPAYFVVAGMVGALISSYYASKIRIAPIKVSSGELAQEAGKLLQLGFVFLLTGLMPVAVLFILRLMVTRQQGEVGAGQFQAANALSLVYIGFVLQAMGTDFYPRLTAVAEDNKKCNQLVNEQAEISILLGLPGILGTIALAPWVIHVFYSGKFDVAWQILCWQVAGMFLRVNSWPIGYILVAKGRATAMFFCDLTAYSVYLALGWFGLKVAGLPGMGMAFLGLYCFHWIMITLVVRQISGFRWSRENLKLLVLGLVTIAFTLVVRLLVADPWSTVFGVFVSTLVGLHCLKVLIGHIGVDRVNRYLGKIGLRLPASKPSTPPASPGPGDS